VYNGVYHQGASLGVVNGVYPPGCLPVGEKRDVHNSDSPPPVSGEGCTLLIFLFPWAGEVHIVDIPPPVGGRGVCTTLIFLLLTQEGNTLKEQRNPLQRDPLHKGVPFLTPGLLFPECENPRVGRC